MSIQSYRDLTVWQDSIALAESIYELSKSFPKEEIYGLTAQIRRASVSVAANIAEGHGREQTKPFIQFLRQAQGSLKEVETHSVLAERLGFVAAEAVRARIEQCESLGKRMRALIRSLQDKLGRDE